MYTLNFETSPVTKFFRKLETILVVKDGKQIFEQNVN